LLRFEPSETALVRGGSYGNRGVGSSRGPAARAILAALLAAAIGFGCAPEGRLATRPASSLASSAAAQREFRELHRHWLSAGPTERAKLEPNVRNFLERHGGDPRARLARLYLAWILIQRGELRSARALVDQTRRGPAGSAYDFAEVARAAILVRDGKPEEALRVLEPLEGKLVDADERLLYGSERVHAALAAGKHPAALLYMLRWLAEAPAEDRDPIGARISVLIAGIPHAPLEAGLRGLDAEARSGSAPGRAGARAWLSKAIREQLVKVALERRDGELARRLLDQGPPSLGRGERGGELSRLAVSGTLVPRVAGRAIGVVMSLGSAESRRTSAESAAGIARALGLPERDSDPGAVRLITADDAGTAGGVKTALSELAGDGAAVLIAGVDSRSAAEAQLYADSAGIPVIVLSLLGRIERDGFTFSVGSDPKQEDAVLASEIARRGLASPARVGPGGVACDTATPSAAVPRFPVQSWRRDRVDALMLFGDAACARDAIAELTAAGGRPLLAFGLQCAELLSTLETPHQRIAIASGEFPLRSGSASEGMKRWRERTGRPPTWHAALGHDAALLAAAAISDFALERVDDAREVAALHRRAQKSLATAKAVLWTSDRTGFEGGRQLPRKLRIASRAEPDGS
jgi:ABC-type branched-subunit amino acid transport system substrate-binding protein